jgi:hypothetical protein
MKPSVYVATAFSNRVMAQVAIDLLKRRGFEISHDWTNESMDGKEGAALSRYLRRCAHDDVNGVLEADLIFFINHRLARGACVELGIAIGQMKPIIVADVEAQHNIFFSLKGDGYGPIWAYQTMEGALRRAKQFAKAWDRGQRKFR